MSEGAVSPAASPAPPPRPAVAKVSRSRTVLFTGLWFVGNQVLNFAQQLLIVPIFLKYWGPPPGSPANAPSLYADWIELTSVTAWFSMADAGMQSFVVNRLTGHYAREEWDNLRSDIASATLMYLLVLSTALLVLLGLSFGLPLEQHLASSGRPLAPAAVTVFALMGAYALTMILSGFIGGMYRAMGQANKSPRVAFVHRLLLLVNTILVLRFGGTPLHLAIVYLTQALFITLWVAWDTHRLDRHMALTLRGADPKVALGFLTPSLMFLLLDTGRNLTVQGMTVVVAETIGTTVLFTTTRTMANALRQITTTVSNTVWPELTRISARGEKDKLVMGHLLVVKLTSMLALIPAAMLFFSGTEVYAMWTRGRSVADPRLLQLFLIDVVVGTPALASVVILQATNEVRSIAAFQSAAGVVNVVACYVLVHSMGLPGAAVAPLLLTVFLFGTWVPAHVQRYLEQPVRDYWTGIYLPLALISAVTFGACGFAHQHVKAGLQSLAVEAVVASVCAVGLAIPFLFTKQERDFARSMVMRLARR